jgi:hypothetical protein
VLVAGGFRTAQSRKSKRSRRIRAVIRWLKPIKDADWPALPSRKAFLALRQPVRQPGLAGARQRWAGGVTEWT